MGILGNVKLVKRTRRVVVGTDAAGCLIELVVCAPKLQAVDALQAKIAEPTPPLVKGPHGKPVPKLDTAGNPERDPATGHVLHVRNEKDHDYLRACDQREKAMTIAMVMDCLADQLTPTKTLDDHDGDLVAYYLGVWDELEEAGLDVGSFRALSSAAMELAEPMDRDEVEAARATLGVQEAAKKGDPK